MKPKTLLLAVATVFLLLTAMSEARAWYAYHYHVGYRGGYGYHGGYGYNPYLYGAYRSPYLYGGYHYGYGGVRVGGGAGGARYGYYRRW